MTKRSTELEGRGHFPCLPVKSHSALPTQRLAGLTALGETVDLASSGLLFMMGSDSTDAFQVAPQEADLEEPEQERKDQEDLCGYGSWFASTNDTSCWRHPEIAAGHRGQAKIMLSPL